MKQSASVPELRPGGGRGVSQSQKTPPGVAGGQRRGQLCGGVRVCGGEPGPVLGPEHRVHVGGAGQERQGDHRLLLRDYQQETDGCDLCSGGRHCGRQGQFGGTVLQSGDTVCTGGYYYQSTVELFFVYYEESEDKSISEVFELKHELMN